MDGTRIGRAQTSTPAAAPNPSVDVKQADPAQKPASQSATPAKDTFETGGRHIDLFPKDVLQKSATLTPQQHLNAHLNTLKKAETGSERAKSLQNFREYLNTLPPGEQAKALTDPSVQKTISEIVKDPSSPAADMLKDLMKGTVGDVVKGLKAVKPDVDVDFKTQQLKKAGVEVNVGNLLKMLQKDYQDIL